MCMMMGLLADDEVQIIPQVKARPELYLKLHKTGGYFVVGAEDSGFGEDAASKNYTDILTMFHTNSYHNYCICYQHLNTNRDTLNT